jgi:hypothetical protein
MGRRERFGHWAFDIGHLLVTRITIPYMELNDQQPPRPPIAPVDSEEAGCVSGVVLLVAIALTVVMLFIWVWRKVW